MNTYLDIWLYYGKYDLLEHENQNKNNILLYTRVHAFAIVA